MLKLDHRSLLPLGAGGKVRCAGGGADPRLWSIGGWEGCGWLDDTGIAWITPAGAGRLESALRCGTVHCLLLWTRPGGVRTLRSGPVCFTRA